MTEKTDARRDKRRKAHPEEVDTSNGALFLRTVHLEHENQALRMSLRELERRVEALERNAAVMRIGGRDD